MARAGAGLAPMALRCDVVAVGTELLLGQITDTNSAQSGVSISPPDIT